MKLFEYTAKGRYYWVLKDGLEISKHTTEREAIENANAIKLSNPDIDVRYTHKYEVEVVATNAGHVEDIGIGTVVDLPPTIISTPDLTGYFTEDTSNTYDMSQHWTDDGISPVTSSLSNTLPNGLTYNGNTHILTYDGVSGATVSSHQLTATDTVGFDQSVSFDIEVVALDSQPQIISTPSLFFVDGISDTYDMSQHWTDDAASTVTSSLLPSVSSGDGLFYNGNTHILTYDGIAGVSSNSHTLTVTDAVGSDISLSFNIPIQAVVGNTALELFANGMSIGWAEYTSVTGQDVYVGSQSGNSGTIAKFVDEMPWNAFNKTINIFSGDHNGGGLRHVSYVDSTDSFELTEDAPMAFSTTTKHGYDHTVVNPYTGDLYHVPQGNGPNSEIWKKVFGGSNNLVSAGNFTCPFSQITQGLCWWSGEFTGAGVQGGLLFFGLQDAGFLRMWDPISGTQIFSSDAAVPGIPPPSTYHVTAAYSPTYNVAVYGGGNLARNDIWRLGSDGTITKLTNCPIGLGAEGGNVTVDPVTGTFLVHGSNLLYELDPTGAGTWTQLAVPPANVSDPMDSAKGEGCIACSITDYGVTAYISQDSASGGRMHLYKRAANTAEQSWQDRSTLPGVLMATRFDTEAEVTDGTNNFSGSPFPDASHVTWNTTQQASGNGCMQFDVLKTDTSQSGQWWRYLNDDESPFGVGDTIYVQYKAYFPAYYATHQFDVSSQSGWKVSIISNARGSNQLYEIVHQNNIHRGHVQGYNRNTAGQFPPWETSINTPCLSTDFLHQNAIDRNPELTPTLGSCLIARRKYGGLYSWKNNISPSGPHPDPETGAFIYYPDEWLTFLQKVTYGSFGTSTADSQIEMWAAREADTTYTKLFDRMIDLGADTGDGLPDALWLLPYDTNRLADPTRQDTYTLRDEVIVSTNWIPMK